MVRWAEAADAAAIAEVHVRAWQHAYRGLILEAFLDSLSVPARNERWAAELARPGPRSGVLVAVVAGAVAGFCSFGPSRDGPANDATGELLTIYVAPGRIGRGIGSVLIDRVVAALAEAGFRQATLWVLVGNARVRAFYERHGWRADGATKTEAWRSDTILDEVRYRIALG